MGSRGHRIMDAQRVSAGRQYVVAHLKLIEVLHLVLLSLHISDTRTCPENVLDHGVDRFKETLLGATINAFMSMCDNPKSTNIRDIWKQLHPKHARAIDRIWSGKISAGERVMKSYRDQAGAHGDQPTKYFAARVGLLSDKALVITALQTFCVLAVCLLRRQTKELPEFASEIEGVLLDIELSSFAKGGAFNRRWLREMHLVGGGPYTKRYP